MKLGQVKKAVSKLGWMDQPTENVFAKGMTNGEVIMDWLSRHKIPQENGRYVFYHGTPKKGGAVNNLREGSLLANTKEEALHYAKRDRDLKDKDVNVIKVLVKPEEIRAGGFASLRGDYNIQPTATVQSEGQGMNLGQAKKILNKNTVQDIIAPMSRKTGTANIPAKTTPQAEAGYNKVYHATRENFDKFNLEAAEPVSEQGFGAHWFFENEKFADDYLEAQSTAPEGRGNNPRVIEAYIDKKAKIFDVKKQKDRRVYRQIQKELDREYEDVGYLPDIDPYSDRHPIGYPYIGDSAPELIEKLKERGYDGTFFDEGNGRKSTAIWNEDLIKSELPNPTRPPEVGGRSTLKSLIPIAAGASLYSPQTAQAKKYKQMESDQALQDAYSPVDMIIAGATGGATMGLRAISALADPVINYAIDRMLGD